MCADFCCQNSSTGGLSGVNAQKVLDNLGIAEAVKGKAILKSSGQDLIASGEAEIGLFNVSEIPRAKGVVLAGKVPAAVQAYINYDAAVPAAQNSSPNQAVITLRSRSAVGSAAFSAPITARAALSGRDSPVGRSASQTRRREYPLDCRGSSSRAAADPVR